MFLSYPCVILLIYLRNRFRLHLLKVLKLFVKSDILKAINENIYATKVA